jgi:hypothetical protein
MALTRDQQAMADGIGAVIAEEIERAVAPLRQRIAELEKRGVEYVGVYQRAVGYRRGSIVTFDNNMHVAIKDTQPGEAPLQCSSWQLCLKGTHVDKRAPTAPRAQVRP